MFDKNLKFVGMTTQLILILVIVELVSSSTDNDIVSRIINRYNIAPDKCFEFHEKPAYECSGIMIRGVNNNDPNIQYAWGMKDLNQLKDAFSVAYLRRDQVFSSFPRGYDSGFIVYPHMQTPQHKNKYKVYCSFPMDAHTDGRRGHGCGRSNGDRTRKSSHCGKQNIRSFDDWIDHFEEIKRSRDKNFVIRQCGFDMRTDEAADYFSISLKANRYIQSHSEAYALRNNELRIHAWSASNAKNLPIEAFFYLIDSANGESYAEKYQDEFYARSGGEIVPIIGIRLPTTEVPFGVRSHERTPVASLFNNFNSNTIRYYSSHNITVSHKVSIKITNG